MLPRTFQDIIYSVSKFGFVITITNYTNNDEYKNCLYVQCGHSQFVVEKESLFLCGQVESMIDEKVDYIHQYYDQSEDYDMAYGFHKVAKAFLRGERGLYKEHTVKKSIDLYCVLSPFVPAYRKFALLLLSEASREEVRKELDSLVGSIVSGLDKETLQELLTIEESLPFEEFLLTSLRERSSLCIE